MGCCCLTLFSLGYLLSTNFCLFFFPTSTEEEKYFLFWTLVAYNISYTFFFVWTDRRSCKSLVFYIQFIRFPHIPTSPPLTERTMYRSTAADHLTADPFFYPLVSLYFFLVFDSSIPFFHFIPFFSFACTYTMWRSELLPRPGDFNQLGCVRQKWCSSSVLIFHPSNSQFNLSIPTKAKQSTVREPITTWLLFKSTNSIYFIFCHPKRRISRCISQRMPSGRKCFNNIQVNCWFRSRVQQEHLDSTYMESTHRA